MAAAFIDAVNWGPNRDNTGSMCPVAVAKYRQAPFFAVESSDCTLRYLRYEHLLQSAMLMKAGLCMVERAELELSVTGCDLCPWSAN